jgi:hypothetical protein
MKKSKDLYEKVYEIDSHIKRLELEKRKEILAIPQAKKEIVERELRRTLDEQIRRPHELIFDDTEVVGLKPVVLPRRIRALASPIGVGYDT